MNPFLLKMIARNWLHQTNRLERKRHRQINPQEKAGSTISEERSKEL